MKRFSHVCAIVGSLGFSATLLAGEGAPCAACSKATAATVQWCDACKAGMAYGHKIASKMVMDALAAQKADAAGMKCPDCKTALEKNSTCAHCHVSFNKGMMYHSAVACALSKGEVVTADKVQCPACKAGVEKGSSDFCTKCNAGVVGGLVFKGQQDYDAAKKYAAIFEAAIKDISHCEACAVAVLTDGTCEKCKETFKDGKLVEPKPEGHGG